MGVNEEDLTKEETIKSSKESKKAAKKEKERIEKVLLVSEVKEKTSQKRTLKNFN